MAITSWGSIGSIAAKVGSKYPELVSAQWALESGWGKYTSGKNNFFGLKGSGTKTRTTEFVNGQEVSIVDEFINFESVEECVDYLVTRWYKDFEYKGTVYKGVNNANDRREAAKLLVKEGYCTDPSYAVKLVDLMEKNSVPDPVEHPIEGPLKLSDAARYYKGLPHQNDAWEYLQSILSDDEMLKFTFTYRRKTSGISNPEDRFPLDVPYFYQRDSKTGHGERSCQSSALAMVVEYINPDLIIDDDDYLNLVFRYGDTVSQSAQKQALDSLNIKNRFLQNGKESDLIKILDEGCPVPIGVLHKGPVSSPTGGGHYITVIGYDKDYFYVHDPFGEMDLVNGGYTKTGPTDGISKKYTRKNLMKRWLINGDSDGWYWDLRGN